MENSRVAPAAVAADVQHDLVAAVSWLVRAAVVPKERAQAELAVLALMARVTRHCLIETLKYFRDTVGDFL